MPDDSDFLQDHIDMNLKLCHEIALLRNTVMKVTFSGALGMLTEEEHGTIIRCGGRSDWDRYDVQ